MDMNNYYFQFLRRHFCLTKICDEINDYKTLTVNLKEITHLYRDFGLKK